VPTCFGRLATIVVPTLPNENREILGTNGDDVIVGGAGDDIIFGDGGDDRICARWGRDVVYGWEGNDRLSGARGWDRLYAEMGNDVLGGGAGRDVLAGGLGSDLMRGGPGTDTADFTQDNLEGPIIVDLGAGTATDASGSDVLGPGTIENVAMNCSAEQDDVLIGDDRPNGLSGGSGADLIRGNGGTDALYGGTPFQDTGDAISRPPLRSRRQSAPLTTALTSSSEDPMTIACTVRSTMMSSTARRGSTNSTEGWGPTPAVMASHWSLAKREGCRASPTNARTLVRTFPGQRLFPWT
jgi:hypothetical protein